jgi:hypothetical protein
VNSQHPLQAPTVPPLRVPAKGPDMPLGAAILLVRVLEFLVVGLAGLLLVWFGAFELDGNLAIYGRVTLIAALAFAVLAESLGSYDIEAQFSLRLGWRRVTLAWAMTALFLITMGYLLKASDAVSRAWAIGWFLSGGASLLLARALSTMWVRRLKNDGR